MTDTHSHIFDRAFDDDRADVLTRAKEAGVEYLLCPAIDSETHAALLRLAEENPGFCLPMIGLHPTSVNGNYGNSNAEPNGSTDWMRELEIVEQYLAAPPVPKFYAIGEVGLDLHWSRDFLAEQTSAFERQIALALRYDIPLAIHTREAWPQMLDTLEKYTGTGLCGVMHAFSGTLDDYLRLRAVGDFVLGVGGSVTYKKSPWQTLLPRIDPTHIVLETDAPWLAPEPFRGRRNEPSYLTYIRDAAARISGIDPGELDRITTQNAKRIFRIGQ